MRWDFFYRRQNNDPSRNLGKPLDVYVIDIDTEDLGEAIRFAVANGVKQGDYASGIVEVQNDLGIYKATDNKRLWSRRNGTQVVRKVVEFKTWDQIENEEDKMATMKDKTGRETVAKAAIHLNKFIAEIVDLMTDVEVEDHDMPESDFNKLHRLSQQAGALAVRAHRYATGERIDLDEAIARALDDDSYLQEVQ